MTDTTIKVREHYSATRLSDRIKSALSTIAPEGHLLTVAQLAPLDQFHTRGILWRDDTQIALDWFKSVMAGSPPSALNLGLVIGPDFPAITDNLVRNIRENRLGVLSAVLTRN